MKLIVLLIISISSLSAFSNSLPYTLQKTGSGQGRVAVASDTECHDFPCQKFVGASHSVTLTAIPAAGSIFAGWTGACTNSTATLVCRFEPRATNTITARFNLLPAAAATQAVNITISGNGYVSFTRPSGIANCRGTCSIQVPTGTNVEMTAFANTTSHQGRTVPLGVFRSWIGCSRIINGTKCIIEGIERAKNLMVSF